MMTHYGDFPVFELVYDTGGHLIDPAAQNEMIAALSQKGTLEGWTDLILISHGWNNNEAEARDLYTRFFAALHQVMGAGVLPKIAGRKIAVAAVFWPSKRFTDPSQIPGGAAGLSDPTAQLNAQLDDLKSLFPDPDSAAMIEHARAQLSTLETSKTAQDDFVHAIISLMPQPRGPADEGLDAARKELDSPQLSGSAVLQRLSMPIFPTLSPFGSGSATSVGAAAGINVGEIISNLGGGIKNAASALLNVTTYYTMKDRAGIVGQTGVLQTLGEILKTAKAPQKVHLVGHSFGGRLVTAAANALQAGSSISTLSLLEAAYSHYGLAQNWNGQNQDGAFRSIVSARKVKDCISITHSSHDWPCGYAYPVASRIMNQVASAIWGGASDIFGAIGRNGAQRTPEAFNDTLHPVGTAYVNMPAGKWIRNLSGDGPAAPVITSHGDVAKPEIAYAVLSSF